MDPVSIVALAATAAQSADLAVKALTNLCPSIKHVREAPKMAGALRKELTLMNTTIVILKATFENVPRDILTTQFGILMDTMKEHASRDTKAA
jgi:hypothetical protein